MKFSINQKIEEIRQKPEHIRMRYVWAWLAISMAFVFVIWVFSVKENFSSIDFEENNLSNLRSEMPDFGGSSSLLESGKESISNLENEVGQE